MNYVKYKTRTCKTLHYCAVCNNDILPGERYHDGGYGRRAHIDCASSYEITGKSHSNSNIKNMIGLDNSIDFLAGLFNNGALLVSTNPEEFIKQVSEEIQNSRQFVIKIKQIIDSVMSHHCFCDDEKGWDPCPVCEAYDDLLDQLEWSKSNE